MQARANLFLTMSNNCFIKLTKYPLRELGFFPQNNYERNLDDGGGGRDRTDDLKLAKLPLSQLSYAPQ